MLGCLYVLETHCIQCEMESEYSSKPSHAAMIIILIKKKKHIPGSNTFINVENTSKPLEVLLLILMERVSGGQHSHQDKETNIKVQNQCLL